MPGCVQLISSDMKFVEEQELYKYMDEQGLMKVGDKFHTVSIIGGQSSGKSTLLNALFGTEFDTMDASKGRRQTTQGIWCSRAAKANMLVLDVEGTDGREKEDQKAFEGKSALFSLALTDVMMVNMWMHEVGRFNAANLPLLRTVFEVHLKLVHVNGKEVVKAKPLLLFILRDCDGSTPVTQLQTTITTDLTKIWDTMNKPDEFSESKLEEFFEVQCKELPHYKYETENWKERVRELSTAFLPGGPVFQGRSSKDVPAEGFPAYAAQLWKTIESDGDLDLPTQRKMLSMVRCDAKRKALTLSVQSKYPGWIEGADESDFKSRVEEGVAGVKSEFDEGTTGYDEEIRNDTIVKLEQDLWPVLQEAFDSLTKKSRHKAEAKYSEELSKMMPEEGKLPEKGFSVRLRSVHDAALEELRKSLVSLIPDKAPWRDRVHDAQESMRQNIGKDELAAKRQLVAHVQGVCQRRIKEQLSRALVPLLDEVPDTLWQDVQTAHRAALEHAKVEMKQVLEDAGMWEDKFSRELTRFADTLVNDKFSDKSEESTLAKKMFEKFDMNFNRARSRMWRLWDNPDQDMMRARELGLRVLDMISSSQLYKDGEWPEGTSSVRYINDDRREQLEADFEAKVRGELVWAQMTRANSSTHTSMLAGVLIVVLGWNEIFWLLTHPIYLFLFIAFTGGAAVYYFLNWIGDWPQLVAMALRLLAGGIPGAPATPTDPLAHCAHLAGPPGREKRPATAPARSAAT